MNTDHIRKIADAMSQYGYTLGYEAENVTKVDLVLVAQALQANVDILRMIADNMSDDLIN